MTAVLFRSSVCKFRVVMWKRQSGDRNDHGRGLGVFFPGFEYRVRHGSYPSSSCTYVGYFTSAQPLSFRLECEYCAQGGYLVAHVVGTLRYKPLGRGFDFFCRTVALRSTQPLTEMSTRGVSWSVKAFGVQD